MVKELLKPVTETKCIAKIKVAIFLFTDFFIMPAFSGESKLQQLAKFNGVLSPDYSMLIFIHFTIQACLRILCLPFVRNATPFLLTVHHHKGSPLQKFE